MQGPLPQQWIDKINKFNHDWEQGKDPTKKNDMM
jgi:hypothetical protein